jgi:hypothetical protein
MFSLTSSKSFELAWYASDMNSSSWSVLETKVHEYKAFKLIKGVLTFDLVDLLRLGLFWHLGLNF